MKMQLEADYAFTGLNDPADKDQLFLHIGQRDNGANVDIEIAMSFELAKKLAEEIKGWGL